MTNYQCPTTNVQRPMTNVQCPVSNDQVCSPAFRRFQAPNRLKPGLQTLDIGAWSFIGHWSLVIGHCYRSLIILSLCLPSFASGASASPDELFKQASDAYNAGGYE